MKVLVALDLSVSSSKVVDAVKSIISSHNNVRVWVLHVADPEPDFVGNDVAEHTDRVALANKFHEEHKDIQKIAEDIRSIGMDCTALLIQGSIAEAILAMSYELDADLIAIGSHGKGVAKQLLVGSTSEAILESSELPVLVVPVR